MTLERIREEVKTGLSFNEALQKAQDTTVFTTHTPVPSGHDVFPVDLIDKYFADYWPSLDIDREKFLDLGRPDNRGQAGFNMTALAINTANQRNAVSRLHEKETKKMWHIMWPGIPEERLPITHVTNGVHVPTWIAHEFVLLFEKYLGKDWLKAQDDINLWKRILEIPDEEIWEIHRSLKGRLIEVILERAQRRWADGEVTAQQVVTMGAKIENSLIRGPVSIASNCHIVNSFVGPYTSIGTETDIENSSVEYSIILNNSRIKDIRQLSDSVIGRNTEVVRRKQEFESPKFFIGDYSRVEL